MDIDTAHQIALLINSQNELLHAYTANKVLQEAGDHLWHLEEGRVVGVVRVQRKQWYQAEISHLSVASNMGRRGIGGDLLKRALSKATELGARIAQCTIREGNYPSINLFTKFGFKSLVDFYYPLTGNTVKVFQKRID